MQPFIKPENVKGAVKVTAVVTFGTVMEERPVNWNVPAINRLLKVVPLIVTVPRPRLVPTKNAFTLMKLPLTHGMQDVGAVKPGSCPEAVTEKFCPAKL
jgi:hypothetical protein